MRQLAGPDMRIVLASLPSGDAGTFATAEAMRDVANQSAVDPKVREVAIRLARGTTARDVTPQIAAIRRFLAESINFIDDPQTAELVQSPAWLLDDIEKEGVTAGDCDDVATLGAALGQAIGIPARFVLAGFEGSSEPYSHVWTELHDGAEWRELDTTRPAPGPDVTRQTSIDMTTGERHDMMTQGGRIGPQQAGGGVGFLIVPAVTGGIALVHALGPLLSSPRAADRIRAIDEAFNLAVAGNDASLLFLRQRTGDYGVVSIPGMPGQYGGFATAAAKAYARQRYDQAMQIRGTLGIPILDDIPPGVAQAGMGIGVVAAIAVGAFFLMKKR